VLTFQVVVSDLPGKPRKRNQWWMEIECAVIALVPAIEERDAGAREVRRRNGHGVERDVDLAAEIGTERVSLDITSTGPIFL